MEPRSSNKTGDRLVNDHKRRNTLFTLLVLHILTFLTQLQRIEPTSINYGISQRPITDISQLMPTLCQNQSVICEGSFCIPGLRRCVCDLRQPVQFGRFCLRQVDIETKCFATNQCNHTIKDAVCVDTNTNSVLDVESSRYKLEQWQQLNELRQASKSAIYNQENAKQKIAAAVSSNLVLKPIFLIDGHQEKLTFNTRDDVIVSRYRNSPYEINYYTPELLHQNHTRRKTNSSDRLFDPTSNVLGNSADVISDTQNDASRIISNNEMSATRNSGNSLMQSINVVDTTTSAIMTAVSTAVTTNQVTLTSTMSAVTSPQTDLHNTQITTGATSGTITTTQATTTLTNELSKKKMIIKTPNWPPGVCSCPPGYMFDSMLRKCLALSLVDSHCQSDNDCKQIRLTHCSSELRKCECDEPLVWNHTELACQRPRPVVKTDIQATNQPKESFLENLVTPLLMAKVLPDHTMLLLLFVIFVIVCTLLLLKLVVKCFSSSNSVLISPKNSKKRKGASAGGENTSNLLPPKSPYATLRKPEHKPNTPLSNFTQAARGRILNYDFEQDNPSPDSRTTPAAQQAATYVAQKEDQQHHSHHHHYGTLDRVGTATAAGVSSTLSRQKQKHKTVGSAEANSSTHLNKSPDKSADDGLELNDNVSLGQMDSESKSESTSVLAIPGPPPTQAPPYMLASAMKGQGSAIAAAAAAVANRRMQMAHKKGLTETKPGKVPNGNPVFL